MSFNFLNFHAFIDITVGLDKELHCVIAELRAQANNNPSQDNTTQGGDVEMGIPEDDHDPEFEDLPADLANNEAFVYALCNIVSSKYMRA